MRLALVTLLVSDYEAALAFYVGGVGFTVLEDKPLGQGKRWVVVRPPGGGAALLLAKAAGAEQAAAVGRQAGGRVAFFLASENFAADHATLSTAGANFEEAPRDEAYGRVAVWRDPFGNRWDLVQWKDRPPECEGQGE